MTEDFYLGTIIGIFLFIVFCFVVFMIYDAIRMVAKNESKKQINNLIKELKKTNSTIIDSVEDL